MIHYVRDYPDHPVKYASLITMMQTIAECYESGAYSLDDLGFFEVNADAERMIAARLNPGIDYWKRN